MSYKLSIAHNHSVAILRIILLALISLLALTATATAPNYDRNTQTSNPNQFHTNSYDDVASQLRIRVWPTAAHAPATITVRAEVTPHDDNRELIVTIDGENAYMSSLVQLEGSRGPRFSELQFHKLPSGAYEVLAVIMGAQKPRATVRQYIVVTE